MTQIEIPMAKRELLKQRCLISERAKNPLIKAQSLAYVVFQRPDLSSAKQFFEDFGLVFVDQSNDHLFFRGREGQSVITVVRRGEHRLSAIGFRVELDDVEKVSQERTVAIEDNLEPLGGKLVSLIDPDGVGVELCVGLHSFPSIDPVASHTPNFASASDRVGEVVRYDIQANPVNRLGHTVVGVAEIKKTLEWYQQTLGMIVSDFQFVEGDGLPVASFTRFDRGVIPTDHHSIAFASIIETGHVHTAYEMENFEEVAISGEWNREKGYKHAWGIGRHVLGSQIFDYWREPNGDLFEHYADGDVFDDTVEAGYQLISGHAQHQWGPKTPKEFTGENRPLRIIKSLFRRLPSDDDLTFKRLKRILKAINS